MRRRFLRARFGFDCECPRCSGGAVDADGRPIDAARASDGRHGVVASLTVSADAALEALAEDGEATGDGRAAARAAREAHRQLVRGVSNERGELIGLELREHPSYEAALAATEPFAAFAAALAPTHWQRHQVRSLRCLCLLRVPNKAVPCLLLVAEHMAAEMQLLPKGHLLRLAAYRQFRAALGACPPAIRPRLVERARDTHGALDLRWLEHVQGWLRQEPLGAVAQPR